MKAKMVREGFGWNPPKWVALPIIQAWFEIQGLDMEQRGQWITDVLLGCIKGEREEGSFADRLLQDWADRSRAGRKAASARWARGKENAPAMRPHSACKATAMRPQCGGNAKTGQDKTGQDRTTTGQEERSSTTTVVEKTSPYATTDRKTDARGNPSGFEHGDSTQPPTQATATAPTPTPPRQPGKPRHPTPTPKPTPAATPTETAPAEVSRGTRRVLEKFAADPYGYRDSVPAHLLPNVAVVFCDECDETRALTAFQRKLQKMGAARFREVLYRFMDDCLHSDPTNRGAALMKRLEMLGSLS